MFLRSTFRKKDGKEHEYFPIVENRRVAAGKIVQRHVLYLGEINSTQQEAWRKTIEIFEDGQVPNQIDALEDEPDLTVANARPLARGQFGLKWPLGWPSARGGGESCALLIRLIYTF